VIKQLDLILFRIWIGIIFDVILFFLVSCNSYLDWIHKTWLWNIKIYWLYFKLLL